MTRRQRRKAKRLTYSPYRCACGALFAADHKSQAWDCSDVLLGLAAKIGEPGAVAHSDIQPYVFWKVKAVRDQAWALAHRVEAPA